jgi:hypothetical protein
MTNKGDFTAGDVLQASDLNAFSNVTQLFGANATLPTATLRYWPFAASEVDIDVSDWHNPTTNNSRVTPDVAGWYRVTGSAVLEDASVTTGTRLFVGIYKNRASPSAFSNSVYAPNYPGVTVTGLIEMNGTTDYLEVGVFQTAGADRTISRPSLTVELVRAS